MVVDTRTGPYNSAQSFCRGCAVQLPWEPWPLASAAVGGWCCHDHAIGTGETWHGQKMHATCTPYLARSPPPFRPSLQSAASAGTISIPAHSSRKHHRAVCIKAAHPSHAPCLHGHACYCMLAITSRLDVQAQAALPSCKQVADVESRLPALCHCVR